MKNIELQIEAGGKRHRLRFEPGEKKLIGRIESCDVRLSGKLISKQHLEIFYDGDSLIFKDLDTKNGSFRLPQKAPFVQSDFPTQYSDLRLLLGDVACNFSWKPEGASVDKTQVSRPKNKKTADSKGPVRPKKSQASPRPERKARVEREFNFRKRVGPLFHPLPILLLGVGLAGLFYWRLKYPVVWESDSQGYWIDSQILFWESVRFHGAIYIFLFSMLLFLAWRLSGTSPLRWVFRIFAMGVLLLSFFWPLLGSPSKSFKLHEPINRFLELIHAEKSPNEALEKVELEERAQELKGMMENFKHSSLFYKHLLENHVLLALDRCGGVGNDKWEKKKQCMMLLTAVTMESAEEIRPEILGEFSRKLLLLMSLDGLMRVLRVEGADSISLELFLLPLSVLGLEEDRALLEGILLQNSDVAEKLVAVSMLKQLTEESLVEIQDSPELDSRFKVKIPDPLELGI